MGKNKNDVGARIDLTKEGFIIDEEGIAHRLKITGNIGDTVQTATLSSNHNIFNVLLFEEKILNLNFEPIGIFDIYGGGHFMKKKGQQYLL